MSYPLPTATAPNGQNQTSLASAPPGALPTTTWTTTSASNPIGHPPKPVKKLSSTLNAANLSAISIPIPSALPSALANQTTATVTHVPQPHTGGVPTSGVVPDPSASGGEQAGTSAPSKKRQRSTKVKESSGANGLSVPAVEDLEETSPPAPQPPVHFEMHRAPAAEKCIDPTQQSFIDDQFDTLINQTSSFFGLPRSYQPDDPKCLYPVVRARVHAVKYILEQENVGSKYGGYKTLSYIELPVEREPQPEKKPSRVSSFYVPPAKDGKK